MLKKTIKKWIILSAVVVILSMQYGLEAEAAEVSVEPIAEGSVSDNSASADTALSITVSGNSSSEDAATNGSVSDNSAPAEWVGKEDNNGEKEDFTPDVNEEPADFADKVDEPTTALELEIEVKQEAAEEEPKVETQVISSTQMQTINYKDSILTDWQQIIDVLRTLSPEALANADTNSGTLMLQMKNVTDIPAGIKDGLAADGSGYVKALHCNVGYGVALVFNGNTDNSGFNGISNASAAVVNEKRGKRSMATTVRFGSHESLGTVATLHVNLPQCDEGTKVSVYAETISVDAAGNVTVGENVCIGNTKADVNGNVEVPIQSTANYMFVYKAAKE